MASHDSVCSPQTELAQAQCTQIHQLQTTSWLQPQIELAQAQCTQVHQLQYVATVHR